MDDPAPSRLQTVRADVMAGITVALVGVPQCLAYAIMSGLPPAYGLVTAVVPGLVAAVMGRSPHVVTGPTNTTGLLILVALTPYLGPEGTLGPPALHVLATLTLLAGLVRVVAVLVRGDVLVRFLPESVLAGFTAGAGILIATMQLDEALGLPPVRGTGLWEELTGLWTLLAAGHRPALPAVLTTLLVVAALVAGRRLLPRWPVALAVILVAAFLAWLGLDEAALVADRSAVEAGWPAFALPTLHAATLRDLVPPAAAIGLLGTLELTVSARSAGGRPDMRREILAQGLANVAGAFAGAFPASASLTRSALVRLANGRTRLALAVAAAAGVPVLLLGGHAIGYIPQAALAGILFATAGRMVDLRHLARTWRAAPEPRFLLAATLAATLLLPLEWAVFVGAGLGLAIHLARTTAPRLTLLRLEGDRLVPLGPGASAAEVVVEVSGDLHYAAVPAFVDDVEALLPRQARTVVVDLTHAHEPRLAALAALEQLAADLRRRDVTLLLCGVGDAFLGLLRRAGSELRATPGRDEPGASARECLLGTPASAAGGGGAPAA